MNKYLTKIAESDLRALTLQKVHGDSSAPGTPGVEGAPVPKLPDLTKKAFAFKNEHLKDVKDTATIAGLGAAGGMLGNHLLGHANAFNLKSALVGGGIGLAADYAGLKLNKVTDKLLPGSNKKETNVPL